MSFVRLIALVSGDYHVDIYSTENIVKNDIWVLSTRYLVFSSSALRSPIYVRSQKFVFSKTTASLLSYELSTALLTSTHFLIVFGQNYRRRQGTASWTGKWYASNGSFAPYRQQSSTTRKRAPSLILTKWARWARQADGWAVNRKKKRTYWAARQNIDTLFFWLSVDVTFGGCNTYNVLVPGTQGCPWLWGSTVGCAVCCRDGGARVNKFGRGLSWVCGWKWVGKPTVPALC